MAEAHVSNDEFLTRLSDLFQSRQQKGHGSVYLTQKRLNQPGEAVSSGPTKATDKPALWDLNTEDNFPVLIRATDGKGKEHRKEKIKLSTIVQPDALETFYRGYADACKAGMQSLKKRDRTKRKKTKAKKQKTG